MLFTYFSVSYYIVELKLLHFFKCVLTYFLHLKSYFLLSFWTPFPGHNFCVLFFCHFYSETQNTQSADKEPVHGHWLLVLKIWGNLFKIYMHFIFLANFQQSDKILCLISVLFTGFENVVSTYELDQTSLACIPTKHWTRHSKRSHSTIKLCPLRNCRQEANWRWDRLNGRLVFLHPGSIYRIIKSRSWIGHTEQCEQTFTFLLVSHLSALIIFCQG